EAARLPVVEPDEQGGGRAFRHPGLDGGTRPRRHGQPLRLRRVRGTDGARGPGQQRLRLPRCRPRLARLRGARGHGHDGRGGGGSARRPGRGVGPAGGRALSAHRLAPPGDGAGGGGGRPGGARPGRRPGPRRRRDPRERVRSDVGAGLSGPGRHILTMAIRDGAPSRAAAWSGIVCAAVALSAVRASSQVDAGFEPVPAANISEQTLSVPEENFSVRAPGPQWDWLRDKSGKGSAGRGSPGRTLRRGARCRLPAPPPGGPAEKYAEDWLARIKAAQEAQGRELVGTRSEPSDVPAPGSLRLSTMITAPGTTIYFTGY